MWRSFVKIPARWFLIITPLLLGAMVAASAYSSHQVYKLEAEAVSVATNGGPSIRYLSVARDVIRHIQLEVGRTMGVVSQDRRPDFAFLGEDERRLHEQLKAYVALPFYPGARPLYDHVVDDLFDFETAADDVLDLLEDKKLAEARALNQTRLRPSADKAGESLSALIDLNAARIADSANRVVRLRPRIDRVKYLAQGLMALLMLVLLLLTWRSIRAAQRLLEDRRRFAEERAQELEQFAGRVAHDLKNPLAAISTRLQLAQLGGERSYEQLNRQILSMAKLIEALLDFAVAGARPSPGARCRLDGLEQDLMPMLREEAQRAGVELSIAPLPALAVSCSQGALTSIVSNLVRNAIKFTGGCAARRVGVSITSREERVSIEVEDTGPGIAAAEQKRLFEPFVRLSNASGTPGLGLGLTIVRRLVDGYGGSMGVRSSPGVGSTFWVELPIASGSDVPAP
jgi:signal transduction histidine kinase